jgi:RimJ/RimL family protein N-acetyltransferase
MIDPDNRASQRVAERLGESRGAPTELSIFGQTYPVEIWEITREDWAKARIQSP